jgi:hypothetical protein
MKLLPFKPRQLAAITALIVAFGLGAIGTRAQEATAQAADSEQPAVHPFIQKVEAAKPRIEQIRKYVGKWEFRQRTFFGGPDAPPNEQVGYETRTMLGDYWLLSETESDLMGQPFQGRATIGFDVVKGRYMMYRVDSLVPYSMIFEGTYNPATKTFTYVCDMKDVWTGLDSVYTIIDREQEDGSFTWELRQEDASGERKLMEATYKRVEE